MYKHIIWEWNETLLDDVQACVDAINCMLEQRQLPSLSRQRYRDIFDFPVKGCYKTLGFDMPNEDWDSMTRELHHHSQDIILIGDTNHDHDVAEELGIDCVLLTGGHQSEERLKRENTIPSPVPRTQLLTLLLPLYSTHLLTNREVRDYVRLSANS